MSTKWRFWDISFITNGLRFALCKLSHSVISVACAVPCPSCVAASQRRCCCDQQMLSSLSQHLAQGPYQFSADDMNPLNGTDAWRPPAADILNASLKQTKIPRHSILAYLVGRLSARFATLFCNIHKVTTSYLTLVGANWICPWHCIFVGDSSGQVVCWCTSQHCLHQHE